MLTFGAPPTYKICDASMKNGRLNEQAAVGLAVMRSKFLTIGNLLS